MNENETVQSVKVKGCLRSCPTTSPKIESVGDKTCHIEEGAVGTQSKSQTRFVGRLPVKDVSTYIQFADLWCHQQDRNFGQSLSQFN